MKRNQIVFFLIIGLALAIIAIGFALQSFSSNGSGDKEASTAVPTTGAPITLRVAVSTVAETWVSDAIDAYNATNPVVSGRAVTVQIVRQDSLPVWANSNGIWSAQNHPQVWIPEASYELAFADEIRLNYEAYKPSLAQTPIIWGAYQSRSSIIMDTYGEFTANAVQQAAAVERWDAIGGNTRWGFIKIAFARPDSTSSGFASLLTLSGEYGNTTRLTSTLMGDSALHTWLEPVIAAVPNFATLGLDPAATMATRAGTADIGLLPESQWLLHYDVLSQSEPFELYYPVNAVVLDFPYTIWNGTETTETERRAAQAFGDYLMSDDQQRNAGESGLRPSKLTQLSEFAPFRNAGDAVQSDYSASVISPENRPAMLSFLNWFGSTRGAS